MAFPRTDSFTEKTPRFFADSMERISSERSVERMFSMMTRPVKKTDRRSGRPEPTVVLISEPKKKGLFEQLKERLTRLKGRR